MCLHRAVFRAHAVLLTSTALAGVSTGSAATRQQAGHTLTYYIAAEEVDWEYAPGGTSQLTGERVDSFPLRNGQKLPDNVYHKAIYHEYTDSTFRTLKPRPPEWQHLGILGPLLRAEVGDTIRVVYRNNTSFPSSLHPHRVFYDKSFEGAPYRDGTDSTDKADDAVPTGGTHVYVWPVPARAGPGPMDGSTVLWMYHSHTEEDRDIYTGLLGPMIIAKRGVMRSSGRPTDVDREIIMAFYIGQEGRSWFADRNMPFRAQLATQGPQALGSLTRPGGAAPYWFKPSINGFTHSNLPLGSLTMRKGERVRWYVFASTNDNDFHSPHWHGNTVLIHGRREDVTTLLPMEMMIADMVPDNVGTWLFHCHVADHLLGGMSVRYRVVGTREPPTVPAGHPYVEERKP